MCRGGVARLIDRYPPEDVFARVPEVAGQSDPVLLELDRLLDDDQLYQQVQADLACRSRLTLGHGRHATPAEVLLRLLVVQHLYAWSYAETVQRVADSLVLRWFCRVYFQRVPTKTTLLRWAATIQPATLQALVDRAARLAQQAHVTRARKRRIDSTCVQTTIHHPTDSGLLGDGVRVLTRLIQRAKPLVASRLSAVHDAFRSRLRSTRPLLQRVHRVRRLLGATGAEQQPRLYQRLLVVTRQTVRQAERVEQTLQQVLLARPPRHRPPRHRPPRRRRAGRPPDPRDDPRDDPRVAHAWRTPPRICWPSSPASCRWSVKRSTKPSSGCSRASPSRRARKCSVCSPPIRAWSNAASSARRWSLAGRWSSMRWKGGIVTRFHVLADDESESRQAVPAIQHHQAVFGRPPRLVTGDRRLHTRGIEQTAQALGVTHVVIPRMGPTTAAQQAHERQRSWRQRYRWRRRYRWRAGIEGRIHSLRRDYGLLRVRSHGLVGLERDVGWGVLASDLRHLAAGQVRRAPLVSQRTASARGRR